MLEFHFYAGSLFELLECSFSWWLYCCFGKSSLLFWLQVIEQLVIYLISVACFMLPKPSSPCQHSIFFFFTFSTISFSWIQFYFIVSSLCFWKFNCKFLVLNFLMNFRSVNICLQTCLINDHSSLLILCLFDLWFLVIYCKIINIRVNYSPFPWKIMILQPPLLMFQNIHNPPFKGAELYILIQNDLFLSNSSIGFLSHQRRSIALVPSFWSRSPYNPPIISKLQHKHNNNSKVHYLFNKTC